MVYDPAWDMPRIHWMQQGSFEGGELALTAGPDEGTLVCLPPINQDWLPLIQGCLSQLMNPSTWIVADDDALFAVLTKVNRLRQMVGGRAECMSLAIRFDAGTCQLQQSTDGGGTWTEVDGWSGFAACLPPQTLVDFGPDCVLNISQDNGGTYVPVPGWADNFGTCVQELAPIVGLPPNPGDQSPSQLACSIASYLAENIIINAIGKAVTDIQDDLTLLQFGLGLLAIIPEFVIVAAGAEAFAAIYGAIKDGDISDFEDALSDGMLLVNITCAIYSAINGDGYVTPGNFAAIVTNIEGITYAHPDVLTAIAAYVSALGPAGLAQLSQIAGLETSADCTSCGGPGEWCYEWEAGLADICADFTSYLSVATCSADVWTSGLEGGVTNFLYLTLPLDPTTEFTAIDVHVDGDYSHADVIRIYAGGVGGTVLVDNNSVSWAGSSTGGDTLLIGLQNTGGSTITVDQVTIKGNGSNPFGASNC